MQKWTYNTRDKNKKKVRKTKKYLSWLQYLHVYWVTHFITEELALEAKTWFIIVLLLSLWGTPFKKRLLSSPKENKNTKN